MPRAPTQIYTPTREAFACRLWVRNFCLALRLFFFPRAVNIFFIRCFLSWVATVAKQTIARNSNSCRVRLWRPCELIHSTIFLAKNVQTIKCIYSFLWRSRRSSAARSQVFFNIQFYFHDNLSILTRSFNAVLLVHRIKCFSRFPVRRVHSFVKLAIPFYDFANTESDGIVLLGAQECFGNVSLIKRKSKWRNLASFEKWSTTRGHIFIAFQMVRQLTSPSSSLMSSSSVVIIVFTFYIIHKILSFYFYDKYDHVPTEWPNRQTNHKRKWPNRSEEKSKNMKQLEGREICFASNNEWKAAEVRFL